MPLSSLHNGEPRPCADHPHRAPWTRLAAVMFAATVLGLLATWPLVLHFGTHVPGSERWGDRSIACETPANLWNLWWFRYAIVELHQNPFDCRYTFYPYGANLWFHTLAPLHALIGLAFQTFLSLPATRNMILLLDLVGSVGFTYLLARRLDISAGAAFLAGAIYAFSPGIFSHLYAGHFELMSTCWIPAALWLLLGLLGGQAAGCGHAIALGLVLAGAAYTSPYYAVFSVELLWVVMAADWRRTLCPTALKRLGLATLVAAVSTTPLLWAYLGSSESARDVVRSSDLNVLSHDLLSYLVPSFMHPLAAEPLRPIHERLLPAGSPPQESTAFLGYTVLALAAVGLVLRRRAARPLAPLLAVLLVFWVLSLGSHLKVAGVDTQLPLPAALLAKLPVLSQARAPGRYIVLVMLVLALLGAEGWQSLRHRWLRGFALMLIAVEFLPAPLPLFSTRVPDVYRRLRQAPGNFAVLEVPFGISDGMFFAGHPDLAQLQRQLLAQTVHGHPIAAGYVSRLPPSRRAALTSAPVLGTLLGRWESAERETALRDDLERGPGFFADWQIKLILIHPQAAGGLEQRYLEMVLPIARRETSAGGYELLWLD